MTLKFMDWNSWIGIDRLDGLIGLTELTELEPWFLLLLLPHPCTFLCFCASVLRTCLYLLLCIWPIYLVHPSIYLDEDEEEEEELESKKKKKGLIERKQMMKRL